LLLLLCHCSLHLPVQQLQQQQASAASRPCCHQQRHSPQQLLVRAGQQRPILVNTRLG
jgi:hypothetical protein